MLALSKKTAVGVFLQYHTCTIRYMQCSCLIKPHFWYISVGHSYGIFTTLDILLFCSFLLVHVSSFKCYNFVIKLCFLFGEIMFSFLTSCTIKNHKTTAFRDMVDWCDCHGVIQHSVKTSLSHFKKVCKGTVFHFSLFHNLTKGYIWTVICSKWINIRAFVFWNG